MKTLEQLGISPAPWKVAMDDIAMVFSGSQYPSLSTPHICEVDIIDDPERKCNDIKLIAAAPELYEALRGLLEIVCIDCNSSYKVDGKCVKCPRVVAAEAALKKAGGEE